MNLPLRLGLNIDHVATIRNARGGDTPDPARAAALATQAGAHGITLHLREDRRHIRDGDLQRIRNATHLPINMEMAANDEMVGIALNFKPETAMFVPEKRAERTTESGLNAAGEGKTLGVYIQTLQANGSRVSLFIDTDIAQVNAAQALGANIVEFHTGPYVHAHLIGDEAQASAELAKVSACAKYAASLGIEPQAGHGLTFDTVAHIAAIPQITEVNIGHFLIGEAVFMGLETAILTMKAKMAEGRGA